MSIANIDDKKYHLHFAQENDAVLIFFFPVGPFRSPDSIFPFMSSRLARILSSLPEMARSHSYLKICQPGKRRQENCWLQAWSAPPLCASMYLCVHTYKESSGNVSTK